MPKNSHDVPKVDIPIEKMLFHSMTLRQMLLSSLIVTTSGWVRFHISQKGIVSLLKSRKALCMPYGVTTPAKTTAPNAAAR